jgi:hypothetical protein
VTIAIAQRRGDEILLIADTKITDVKGIGAGADEVDGRLQAMALAERKRAGIDVLPGLLKVVTLADRMTAAFAGMEGPACLAIRDARLKFRIGGPTAALDELVRSSESGETDYLVAVHHGETGLWRIKNGVRLPVDDGEVCAIGAEGPFKKLIERAREETSGSLRKGYLRGEFLVLIMTGRHGEPTVGGFPIAVMATPEGHRYLPCDGGYTYELNIEWGRTTVQPIEQVYTGKGHFQLAIIPAESADVPVVGACLVQARRGYIYSPLERPRFPAPFVVPLLPGEERWQGREREMFAVLRAEIAKHVAAVAAL